jgi:hypothetical protein
MQRIQPCTLQSTALANKLITLPWQPSPGPQFATDLAASLQSGTKAYTRNPTGPINS